jgi:hypothetical protein
MHHQQLYHRIFWLLCLPASHQRSEPFQVIRGLFKPLVKLLMQLVEVDTNFDWSGLSCLLFLDDKADIPLIVLVHSVDQHAWLHLFKGCESVSSMTLPVLDGRNWLYLSGTMLVKVQHVGAFSDEIQRCLGVLMHPVDLVLSDFANDELTLCKTDHLLYFVNQVGQPQVLVQLNSVSCNVAVLPGLPLPSHNMDVEACVIVGRKRDR